MPGAKCEKEISGCPDFAVIKFYYTFVPGKLQTYQLKLLQIKLFIR
jgi:hypothetical protein